MDLFNNVIQVKHNITGNRKTTPKSQASIRRVRITTQLTAIIKKSLQLAKPHKLQKGWAQVPEHIFYAPESGKHINHGNFDYRI